MSEETPRKERTFPPRDVLPGDPAAPVDHRTGRARAHGLGPGDGRIPSPEERREDGLLADYGPELSLLKKKAGELGVDNVSSRGFLNREKLLEPTGRATS